MGVRSPHQGALEWQYCTKPLPKRSVAKDGGDDGGGDGVDGVVVMMMMR